ncbi:MAG: flagellar assembly protein A [Desulfurivibrio sp.]|nr:flagellar assembly protein A [Desulfurivibrio sp.]
MGARRLYNVSINLPSLEDLYQKHQEEVVAAASGREVLRGLLLRAFNQAFAKLRLDKLEEVLLGSHNVRDELSSLVDNILRRIKRDEPDPRVRLDFTVDYDPAPHRRQVIIDIARDRTRLAVKGRAPKDGIDGFLREKGRYAAERRARQRAGGRMDHYTTGEFADTKAEEVLALIDNTKTKGEPGIDIRGMVVKPQTALAYQIRLGEGVAKQETAGGKLALVAQQSGLVKTKYDDEGNLRYLAVEQDLSLGEVGLRSGGHVKAGRGGDKGSLQVENAEFRTVPPAFEARTAGSIVVKELVQGIVCGATVNAEMVNQTAGKYMVATDGALVINRSAQGGTLYAPRVVIGNQQVVATLLNTTINARNSLVGHKLLLAGRNRLLLGSDKLQEQGKGGKRCAVSGQDLFAGRSHLLQELADYNKELTALNGRINGLLMGHVQSRVEARRPLDREVVRRALEDMVTLDREFMACGDDEEEDLRRRLNATLMDIEFDNPLPILRHLDEKKRLNAEIDRRQEKLAAITQPLSVELEIAECKVGAELIIHCWRDELRLREDEQEILIERPADEQRLATMPRKDRKVVFNFDYDRELLTMAVDD